MAEDKSPPVKILVGEGDACVIVSPSELRLIIPMQVGDNSAVVPKNIAVATAFATKLAHDPNFENELLEWLASHMKEQGIEQPPVH